MPPAPLDRATRLARLQGTRLYLILTLHDETAWRRGVEAALATGCVGMVQLRDQGGDEARLLARARTLVGLCHAHGALLLLNDRPDLVAAVGADGAHVGASDLPAEQARSHVGPERLLGLSTHEAHEIARARSRPVDYVGLGPCFATTSKRVLRAPGGAALVAQGLAEAGNLALFPIGGITADNAYGLLAAGAQRLAVGAGILASGDPAGAARRLASMWSGPRRAGSGQGA